MTRSRPIVLVLAALVWPASVRAQASCGTCEHLCMWAPLLMSAEKTKQLFSNTDLVGGVDNVLQLDGAVNSAMGDWRSSLGEVSDSPCYRIIVKEFYDDDPLASSQLNDVVTHLPPSGNLLHVKYDDPKCPIEPATGKTKKEKDQAMKDLKERLCPALLDAFMTHEKVHQAQCKALWKKGAKAATNAFASPQTFAASEVKAYEAQIKVMRESMQKLIDRKQCQVSTHSIEDFAPPPKPDVDVQKALKMGKALEMINTVNAQSGGKK
ncbi:MAG TPA: hypothetical protein VMH40_05945 [Myxococcaceae bacterium]|nr:hypothetical protein [Myxococcaceae bacterium]